MGQAQAALLGLSVAEAAPVPHGYRAGFWVLSAPAGRRLADFAIRPEEAHQVGHHLARLHRLLRHVTVHAAPKAAVTPLIDWAHHALERAPTPAHAADLKLVCQRLARRHSLTGLTHGLIHGALTPGVTQFNAGRLVGAVDFGAVCRGPLITDLARALYAWGFNQDEPDLARMQALVAGYQRLRPLSLPERRALWPQLCLRAMQMALRRLVRFELGDLGEVLGAQAVFAPSSMLYEDYRHDMARLEALESAPQVLA
jgi:Ser/Thr protein kinase RdoA (MazF antagonist)